MVVRTQADDFRVAVFVSTLVALLLKQTERIKLVVIDRTIGKADLEAILLGVYCAVLGSMKL